MSTRSSLTFLIFIYFRTQSSLEDPSNEEIFFFFFFLEGKISLLELRRENRCSAVITRRLICPRRNYIHCSSLYLSAHKRGICLRDDYPRLARSFSPPPRRLGIPSVKNSSENISKEEEIFGTQIQILLLSTFLHFSKCLIVSSRGNDWRERRFRRLANISLRRGFAVRRGGEARRIDGTRSIKAFPF